FDVDADDTVNVLTLVPPGARVGEKYCRVASTTEGSVGRDVLELAHAVATAGRARATSARIRRRHGDRGNEDIGVSISNNAAIKRGRAKTPALRGSVRRTPGRGVF